MCDRGAQRHLQRRGAGDVPRVEAPEDTGGDGDDQVLARHDVEPLPAVTDAANSIDVAALECRPT